ncbi:uncharacterized protein (DUF1810 family) [Rhizomicrobium palustre]|uniref:Uncharacterized protein (DUF1810 family) n=1 Tax=Rhizomicrobium palustre TaxID=189966 RepID=A0A846MVV5_9PROT|nr:DUF1810 domain-containing protein [Rhizomicrobium palustre]NIK87355.1 uncharacterized protein (DUF1810 family) [Rhizomicrobium palustre]
MNGDLQRFVDAQNRVMAEVRKELTAGRKLSHWMWFVFPQIKGLGHSATAQRYALAGLEEARAFLAHPVLGPRLHECVRLVLAIKARSLAEIFGTPDDLKFRSSMTLFARAADDPLFSEALDRLCNGEEDPETLKRI